MGVVVGSKTFRIIAHCAFFVPCMLTPRMCGQKIVFVQLFMRLNFHCQFKSFNIKNTKQQAPKQCSRIFSTAKKNGVNCILQKKRDTTAFSTMHEKKHNNLKICIEERYSLDKYSIALHTHKHIGTGTGTLAAGARQQWKERGRLGACMRQRQRRRRHTETWIDRERAREKEIYRPIYTNTCKHGNRGRMPFNKFFAVSRV